MDVEQDETIYGLFANPQVLSSLHAEFQALLWAMKAIAQMGLTSMMFEADCLPLVKLIDEDEEWPSMTSELDDFHCIRSLFQTFSLVFISRIHNVCADALSKEARPQGISFSHVDTFAPTGMAIPAITVGAT